MSKLGSLAAGIGVGYMAADKWKRGNKKSAESTPSEYETKKTVETGFAGHTLHEDPTPDASPGDAGDNMYANGGLVGDKRWMKKTRR
jgi:hypothetical protein